MNIDKETIIAMAKKAGFDEDEGEIIVGYYSETINNRLAIFANLVAAHEREECARICQSGDYEYKNGVDCAKEIMGKG